MEEGAIVAGKYLLERMVGKGGMGRVFRATHLELQQQVAIKFLSPEAAEHALTVERFMREARAAVRLRGEHVARVLDVGALDAGVPYIVLEYLEGMDLARFPRTQLGFGALIDLMLQACEALAEAHALGIVHRDVKPSNFFITRDQGGALLLKLLDFGVSKIVGANLTSSQIVLGTPAYMSPEQARASHAVDPRSDIWSFGVVLYEMLEGVSPFAADDVPATLFRIVHEPPAKLTVVLPHGLDAIIYRCLEKSPERRFQSVAELAAALALYAGSAAQATISCGRMRGLINMPPLVPTDADGMPIQLGSSELPASAALRKPTRGLRRLVIPAAAVLCFAAGSGIAVLRARSPAAQPGAQERALSGDTAPRKFVDPSTAPSDANPTTAASATNPATVPSAANPTTAPSAANPATASSTTAASAASPATAPSAVNPATAPSAVGPSAAIRATAPSDTSPATAPSTGKPGTAPSAGNPATAPPIASTRTNPASAQSPAQTRSTGSGSKRGTASAPPKPSAASGPRAAAPAAKRPREPVAPESSHDSTHDATVLPRFDRGD